MFAVQSLLAGNGTSVTCLRKSREPITALNVATYVTPLMVRNFLLCKVVNRQCVSESLCDQVELRKSNYNLRGDKILTLPKVNTTKYGSVRYEGANLWNKLPNEYRKADSYKLFKKQILDTDLAGRYMS